MIARLEDLHEMVGESVEDLLRQQGLDLTDTSSVIYLSGSLVEGHGHGTSDVDVYVIGDDEPRGPLNIVVENYQVAIDFGRCRRVDYEYWTPPAVAALAEKLANLDLGRGFLGVLHDAEEEFLHRLRVGVPLTQPEGFRRVQDAFDFDRLRRYLRTKAIREIDNVLDDLTGMLDAGHLEVALLRSADLIGYTVDAWAHHAGSTNPSRKWRLPVLHALPPTARSRQVLDSFWQFRFPDAATLRGDGPACRAHVAGCMEFANTVTDWIQS